MNIISFEKNQLKLNSGILEENFGKMSFSSIITEKGVLVHVEKSDDVYSFDYSSWTFQNVKSFDTDTGRRVFFLGESPFEKTPSTLLNLLEGDKAFEAGMAVIRILTDAALSKPELCYTGAGGILLNLESETKYSALILPGTLFTNATAGLSDEEKARNINSWINPTLYGNQALRFARSNLAYRILTGRLPFPEVNTIERNADILDKKYLPLELCVPGIDEKLTQKINSELELNSAKVNIPGKKEKKSLAAKLNDDRPRNESDAQKAARLQAEYVKAVSAYPMELLENCKEKSNSISDGDFSKKASEYMAKKNARVAAKRKIRRNTGIIVTASIITLVLIILIANTIKTNGLDKTTKGLTAEQVVESWYQQINALDTVYISDAGKGKAPNNVANIVSQMYVIGKNRQAYSRDRGIQNPAAFFLSLKKDTQINEGGLYGVTNLTLNDEVKNMDVKIPVKKEKVPAITEDKGISVYNKMNSVQRAHYYIIHTEAEELFVEEQTELITLTFMKDRWIITDIAQTVVPVKVDSRAFFKDYFSVLELCDNDSQAAVRVLRNKYPWLPDQKAFELEIARQKAAAEEFNRNMGLSSSQN